ncbi:hypothetical protein HAX54_037854 [Datura stramonium]|uniref:Uncharacterized protein n=1 Tax=Datura stramonium TaxID=4076 RepID=A0ABS8VJP3_DATST|nr:hypothetical protein [Datura stramonium]
MYELHCELSYQLQDLSSNNLLPSSPLPAASLQPAPTTREYESLWGSWDNLGFKVTQTDCYVHSKSSLDGKFEQGQLNPFGNIVVSPFAGM